MARCNQKLRCAAWCGGGCTEQQYRQAVRNAAALVRRLGKGWQPRVTENLGWHFAAISPCGRLRVYSPLGSKGGSYSALLGEADGIGGRWAAHGKTPKAAVKAVVKVGKDEVARITGLVAGL